MTATIDGLSELRFHNFQNSKKYNCRLSFANCVKRNNKYNKVNIKTTLIDNEIIDDDNEEFIDNNLMRKCHNFKLCKSAGVDKMENYRSYNKKKGEYDIERDNTFCSLTDMDDIIKNRDKKNIFFYYKNKSLNDYKSCFEKQRKKRKWFRFKRKKKKFELDEGVKYLNESVCSNYKEANKNVKLPNPSARYSKNHILNSTVSSLKGLSGWMF
ncbi:conserved Plasmodium protein, unknown function [Plasmodium vinckei vinckei]|uniref:Uncharacterized protein n=1 Tax=Plasmodium vinckei vinckei TaxID=54757 RepID=A0A449C0I8_PLAVN|nr:conserved Plasmodium protein, unknown function [Plasmodium vinckei vinckei]KEG04093.1 hypothetical protein YYE_00995 [Plasmodium vinckei vinckei]VEV59109.1 conserved Plasmodium protein, unknown function [Plasmodium vinckei vinckei]